MYRFPAPSTATPLGSFKVELAAGPLPEYPGSPFPAIVDMMPLAVQLVPSINALVALAQTILTRLCRLSAMYRLPAPSTASPVGRYSTAAVACLPSSTDPR